MHVTLSGHVTEGTPVTLGLHVTSPTRQSVTLGPSAKEKHYDNTASTLMRYRTPASSHQSGAAASRNQLSVFTYSVPFTACNQLSVFTFSVPFTASNQLSVFTFSSPSTARNQLSVFTFSLLSTARNQLDAFTFHFIVIHCS